MTPEQIAQRALTEAVNQSDQIDIRVAVLAAIKIARNQALEEAAIRGRIAQLEGALVDVQIRALKHKDQK